MLFGLVVTMANGSRQVWMNPMDLAVPSGLVHMMIIAEDLGAAYVRVALAAVCAHSS